MATKIGGVTIRIGASTKQLQDDLKRAERSIQNTANKFKSIGGAMTIGLTAPLLAFAATATSNFDKQAKAIAQVEAGILSTGSAAGLTSKELQKMASDLQSVSTFGDEDILKNVTAQMLTFTNVTGDTFGRAQQAVLDLATRLDGDLKGSAIQVGKALNDPIKGVTALSKVGVSFTEEQKKLIKSLVDTGRAGEAQKIVLSELERQYGGSAQAAAAVGLGPMVQLKNILGDVTEEFGKIILEGLTPFIEKIKDLALRFNSLSPETKKLILVIGGIVAVLGPAIFATGLMIAAYGSLKIAMVGLITTSPKLAAAMSIALGPIGAGIAAIVATLGLIYIYWDRIKDAINKAYIENENFRKGVEFISLAFKAVYETASAIFKTVGNIAGFIKNIGSVGFENAFSISKSIQDKIGKDYGTNIGNAAKDAASNILGNGALFKDKVSDDFVLEKRGGKKEGGGVSVPIIPTLDEAGASKFKEQVKELFKGSFNSEAFSSSDIFTELSKSLATIDDTKLLGLVTATEAVTQKTSAYTSAITSLLSQGFAPMSDEVIKLQTELRKLNGPETLSIEPLNKYGNFFVDTLGKMKAFANVEIPDIKEQITDLSQVAQSALLDTFTEIGTTLGNLFNGDAGAGGFFGNIMTIVADFAKGIGQQMIAIGVAGIALKKVFANPFAAIAAGTALVALSSILRNTISKGVPSLAIGTDYVKQDGLAMLHKGEKVVPANVVKGGYSQGSGEVYGKLSGIDLLLSNRYAGSYYSRLR